MAGKKWGRDYRATASLAAGGREGRSAANASWPPRCALRTLVVLSYGRECGTEGGGCLLTLNTLITVVNKKNKKALNTVNTLNTNSWAGASGCYNVNRYIVTSLHRSGP